MSGHKYGALRGGVVASAEERNEHVSPHYQILVMAGGDPWRIAVNVKSTDTGGSGADPSIVLYRIIDDFRHPILETVKHFQEGFHPIDAGLKNGGLDYIRGNLFNPKDMRLLPPDVPGDDNDLNDLIDARVERAKGDPTAVIFAFGQPWGPENAPDKTFKFKPNRGVHDIHMNQGNPRAGGHAGDNGVWHDGGLLLWFPKADRWVAVFLAFQSQSWHTDDHTGDPIEGRTGAEATRFDTQHRRLAAAEQSYPAIDIIAVRVMGRPKSEPCGRGGGKRDHFRHSSQGLLQLGWWDCNSPRCLGTEGRRCNLSLGIRRAAWLEQSCVNYPSRSSPAAFLALPLPNKG